MKFEKKVAVITGGVRGIGKAITKKLNEQGATTIVTYNKSEKEIDKLYSDIKFSDRLFIYKLDLLDKQTITTFLSEVVFRYTKVDILINNASYSEAGIFGRSFFEYSADDFTKPFEVDVVGGILLSQALVKKMIEQRWGRILFFSSAHALKGDDKTLPFAISKCAIIGVVKSLAQTLAPYNITVNAIAPGTIDTGWIDKWQVPPQWVEKNLSHTPVKRIGTPEDIANFVLFLLSNEAVYITGQIITIDGGAYL
ncbi:MAG: SDR family NAD(P)-dependent oxidoreductase [Planctomycetota bacterium]